MRSSSSSTWLATMGISTTTSTCSASASTRRTAIGPGCAGRRGSFSTGGTWTFHSASSTWRMRSRRSLAEAITESLRGPSIRNTLCAPVTGQTRRDHTMEFIWFILIGLVAGWLAGQFMKGGGFGIIGDIVVGVLGALLGGFLFGLLGISAGGLIGSLVVATIGAVVLIFILRMIKRA